MGVAWVSTLKIYPPWLLERMLSKCTLFGCTLDSYIPDGHMSSQICGCVLFTNERARNHQPLHGIMILLKEVERDPIGPDAPMSRAVIDQTMALCGPDGGVTGMQDDEVMSRPLKEGGQEAWDLITRLRSRAWIVSCYFPSKLVSA